MAINVMIVDDHALFRQGLRALLETEESFDVVAEAESGSQALSMLCKAKPDVVLMDIAMRDMDGLTAARRIMEAHHDLNVVFLTQYENREYILPAIRMGASGYVMKRSPASVAIQAIKRASEGGFFLDPELSDVLVDVCRGENADCMYEALTDRERETLILLAKGNTNKEIAEVLSISVKTVDYHRSNLMRKLNLHSKVDLVKYAIKKGLIDC